MTIVVMAEKPSVGRDIARVLGARNRGDGFLHGNGYVITWALGHLVRFLNPDEYGENWGGRWQYSQLPMIPSSWKLKMVTRVASQFKVVQRLLNDAQTQEVVCATDAGREGENIFRLIYQHARCQKPVRRLWISSLTDEAIREGFQKLKPGTAFDDLGAAARVRTQADWLVGLNLTRAYTIRNHTLCTIGRVQTPTLALIVDRDRQISDFQKHYYYEIIAHMAPGFLAKFMDAEGQTKIEKKAVAESLFQKVQHEKEGRVTLTEKKVKTLKPPPLFDLINLQKEANQRFGLTAATVLKLAQTLYEQYKLISYPRTESRHISEDMLPQLPRILSQLEHPHAPTALQRWQRGFRPGRAYVDKTKLSDHHGIIPTGKKAPPLDGPLAKVYNLVVSRFVAIFLPNHQFEEQRAILDIGGHPFLAKGSIVLEPGWKIAEPDRKDERKPLPPLTKGQMVGINAMTLEEKETKPPKPYNDATLLNAMKTAGKFVEDDALAEAMKESGLGTPATRAEIIEKLIKTGYVLRQKKQLLSTDKGKALIEAVSPELKSPEMTARWEQKLKDVEDGQYTATDFYREIVDFVNQLVPLAKESKTLGASALSPQEAKARNFLGQCPLCNQGQVRETPKAFGCNRYKEGCGFVIWKTVAGKKISATTATTLIQNGQTKPLKGFKSKKGNPFAAALKFDADFKVVFDFSQAPPTPQTHPPNERLPPKNNVAPLNMPTCPKCGQGQIIEGKKGFGCNRYREGCHFVVWKQFGSKTLTSKQILTLIAKGKSPLIKGFKTPEGQSREGRLVLQPDWSVVLI